MEKQKRKNEGITLIALVVTTVVLLILAAISIGVLTGENGIINNAKKSKEDTEIAEEKEVLNLSVAQATGEDVYGNLEEDKFRKKLNENAEGTELEKIGNNYKVTFPSEREYIVAGDGEINQIDKENTVELVAKLTCSYDYDGFFNDYVIGVGFADYQICDDGYLGYLRDILKNKTEEEKEQLFNQIFGTNYTTIEEMFEDYRESGHINEQVTSIEEFKKLIDYFLCENMLYMQYDYNNYKNFMMKNEISGILIAPNGEEYRLSTNNITNESYGKFFDSYCYKYPIAQNGEYKFTFLGDDGSYGEIKVEINYQTPQIVTFLGFDAQRNVLMSGIDNFVDIEEASIELINHPLLEDETINLTSYIWKLENNIKVINLINVQTLQNGGFEGELTFKYDGKEINKKISIRYLE